MRKTFTCAVALLGLIGGGQLLVAPVATAATPSTSVSSQSPVQPLDWPWG
jgi:hypothetical protein